MKGRHTLKLVLALSLVSAGGIVGLLLADGVADGFLMALAALPLAVGFWSLRAQAREGRAQAPRRWGR